MSLYNIIINGRALQIPSTFTILQALEYAHVKVPTLCYSGRLKPRASCRLCLVETNKSPKPVASCITPIQDNLEITTDSIDLKKYRNRELEFLLHRHPNECMTCSVNGVCKLQDLVHDTPHVSFGNSTLSTHKQSDLFQNQSDKDIRGQKSIHRVQDYTSPCIARDMRKCIECGLCVDVCGEQCQDINAIGVSERGYGMLPTTAFEQPLKETTCIDCGQCTSVCPVGALSEHEDWQRVLQELDSKRRVCVVQTAPATRVAIGEEFGLEPGQVSTGRLVNALRLLGFDKVYDTNFAADITIMEEGSEFLNRLQNKGTLPLFTSCCPGWVNYVEKSHPEMIPHLSTAKSPQQMHGALTRKLFGRDVFVVSIMPCTAKKGEAIRPGMRDDVDAVITTRELATMLRSRKISFATLPNDGQYDSPLGESTGAAVIFGATGGVLEAALRTALKIAEVPMKSIDFKQVRGFDSIKECSIDGVGTVAAVNGIGSVQKLFRKDPDWYKKYAMVEVMACPGGCLGGGGEPKYTNPETLQKRMKGVYYIDERSTLRSSFENPDVQKLYKEHLDKPLSHKSEMYLHTNYYARNSDRQRLALFLDAVDRRDGHEISEMFEEDGFWDTSSPFGIISKPQMQDFVASLPKKDSVYPKHRIVGAGLDVIDAQGRPCTFAIQFGGQGKISSLKRIPQ